MLFVRASDCNGLPPWDGHNNFVATHLQVNRVDFVAESRAPHSQVVSIDTILICAVFVALIGFCTWAIESVDGARFVSLGPVH